MVHPFNPNDRKPFDLSPAQGHSCFHKLTTNGFTGDEPLNEQSGLNVPQRRALMGFTLVEMLVTIIVISILAALAVPSFVDMLQSSRTVGATESLAAALREAQIEAAKRNRKIVIAFQGSDSTNWCWGVNEGTACDCRSSQNYPCMVEAEWGRIVTSADFRGVSMSASTNFTFNPVRNTVTAGNVTFTGENNKQGRAVVSGYGRIRLCSPSNNLGGYPSCN